MTHESNGDNSGNNSGNTGPEPGSPTVQNPFHHWPHAAEHARRHFDPEQIEQHAVRILARGVRTQRLIAFVGAGTSMAYGRLTWSDMMDRLHETLCSLGDQLPLWQSVDERLWKRSLQEFRTGGALPLKAQIIDECLSAWEHQQPGGMKRPLHRVAADLLADHQGFLRIWLRTLLKNMGCQTTDDKPIRDLIDKTLQALESPDAQSLHASSATGTRTALDGVINATEWVRGLALLTDTPTRDNTCLERLRPCIEEAANALHRQPTCRTSPLRNLIVDWGIRRFITTNYDEEIQRALKLLDYATDDEPRFNRRTLEDLLSTAPRGAHLGHTPPGRYDRPANHRNAAKTLIFGAESTGEALAFALDGSRRHAHVLHLHGKASQPDGLIITEYDYQALYLADHRQRDLVNNASLANFAANPMLFVGSDVSEDDVLRPLRRFLTGPWHRSDRMSVAVFPALDEQAALARKKAELLVRFRVHAIHAGRINVLSPSTKDEDRKVELNWLYHLFKANAALKKMLTRSPSKDSKPAENGKQSITGLADDEASYLAHSNALLQIDEFHDIEGIQQNDIECAGFDLRGLIAFLKSNKGLQSDLADAIKSDRAGALDVNPKFIEARLHQQVLDLWTNRAISLFVSAKLTALNRQVQDLIERDSKLPEVFHKDIGQQYFSEPSIILRENESTALIMHVRHAISLKGTIDKDRFIEPDKSDPDEENQERLIRAVSGCKSFAEHRGRRVLLICAARGAGKGALSDRLLQVFASPLAAPTEPGVGVQSTTQMPLLQQLLAALNPAGRVPRQTTVMHVNLSFSDEMSALVAHVADAMLLGHQTTDDVRHSKDPLERLERGLVALDRTGSHTHRFVLILGNAGVLFDGKGNPKNGFIQRVLRMLQSRRFKNVPLDIVMFLGEAQVPAHLRAQDRPKGVKGELGPMIYQSAWSWPKPISSTERHIADRHLRRRLDRLNIDQYAEDKRSVLVHAMNKTRVENLAAAYFSKLHAALKPKDGIRGGRPFFREEFYQDLYYETGGSRLAQTLLIACLEAHNIMNGASPREAAEVLLNRLRGSPGISPVEAVIEVVLDTWATRFALLPRVQHSSSENIDSNGAVTDKPSIAADQHLKTGSTFWNLAMEVLWHLSALSQPVEATVLAACPRISHAAGLQKVALERRKKFTSEDFKDIHCIEVTLEWLVHWCLAFRVHPRTLPVQAKEAPELTLLRYTVHRHIQRHFLRLMGGRNVEATYWDQFATTLYASQPDELPTLRPEAHRTLMETLDALTSYPTPDRQMPKSETVHDMVLEAQRIRSAYFLVRSTYSLGVVAHLSEAHSVSSSAGGHMEQYRRRVRWILHAAVYWEELHQKARETDWAKPGWLLEEMKRDRDDKDRPPEPERREMGVFYPGELVWLYNECGVISLAQGKLHDAEQALTLAERAARRIEADDSGSLHTRIKLHSALTQIERGRPHQARRVLMPISERKGGHKVPPLVATFYLGLLEHIGGNYALADQHYQHALKGLREQERSRAAAFVLMNCADLARVLDGGQVDRALTIADSAISLAQQGGHEDLRHLAHLARVRLHVQARRFQGLHLFEELDAAQRYATLLDMPRIACEVHELRARLLYRQGEYRVSAEEATASLEIAALYDLKLMKARGLLTLAKIYRRRGETAGARSLVQTGKEIAASADYFTCVRGFTKLELSLHQPADDIWAGDHGGAKT